MILYAKKEKFVLPMFQNITEIVKNNLIFYCLQTENDSIIFQ